MKIIKNGVICPGVGLWDINSNTLIPESEITRTTISQQELREYSGRDFTNPPNNFKQTKNSVIFGGFLHDHFGHFLLESLAHLNHNIHTLPFPIVYIRQLGASNFLHNYQKEAFSLLGIDLTRIQILHEPTCYESVYFKPPSCRIADIFTNCHAKYLEVFNCYDIKHSKIWLSRKKAGKWFRWSNEAVVEEHLARKGWNIVYPEMLTLKQQLEILTSSEIVAGIEGSAFHGVVLARSITSRFVLFSRHPEPFNEYQLIAKVKNINQQTIFAPTVFNDYTHCSVDVDFVIKTLEDI